MKINNLPVIQECAFEMIRVAENHDSDEGTSICQQNTAALFINTLISSNLNIPINTQNSMCTACNICYFSDGGMDAPSRMVLNLAEIFRNHHFNDNAEEVSATIVHIVNQSNDSNNCKSGT